MSFNLVLNHKQIKNNKWQGPLKKNLDPTKSLNRSPKKKTRTRNDGCPPKSLAHLPPSKEKNLALH
jgi:hypothetical protein